jgi:hypothetical protein
MVGVGYWLEDKWWLYNAVSACKLPKRHRKPLMTDQTKLALAYVQMALNDYAGTMPQSVRTAFIKEASTALQALDTALNKPAEVKE